MDLDRARVVLDVDKKGKTSIRSSTCFSRIFTVCSSLFISKKTTDSFIVFAITFQIVERVGKDQLMQTMQDLENSTAQVNLGVQLCCLCLGELEYIFDLL